MTLAPTFLLYRTGFAPTNGHSVQLERIFRASGDSVVHLMWDPNEAGAKSLPWVIDTGEREIRWKRPFGGVGRALQSVRTRFHRHWWKGDQLDAKRLAAALAALPLRPRQAYLNFYGELDARRAAALWEAIDRPPFVLHMVDILEHNLSETVTPTFLRLVREARHVLCLNQLIRDRMEEIGARSTGLFPLCSDMDTTLRDAPPMPLKVIISGALYSNYQGENRALRLLADVWPKVRQIFPGAELHYSGAEGRGIPAYLRPLARDHGLLPFAAYERLLNSAHLAYVPVHQGKDSRLRYSLPSRIPDYLIRGLPTIALADAGTGIHEFFESTPPACTRLIQTGGEFLAALQAFAGNAVGWKAASAAAVEYSRRAFSVTNARQILFGALNAVGAGEPAP